MSDKGSGISRGSRGRLRGRGKEKRFRMTGDKRIFMDIWVKFVKNLNFQSNLLLFFLGKPDLHFDRGPEDSCPGWVFVANVLNAFVISNSICCLKENVRPR